MLSEPFIHPSSEVSSKAHIGPGTKVWAHSYIRDGAFIVANCNIGSFVYIGEDVYIGKNCKIQNGALICEGVSLDDGVFVGPNVTFTNDKYPRAVNLDGTLKQNKDWVMLPTKVLYGASIGAGSIILPGITIGKWATIGAGSLVTHDVPSYAIVVGSPARVVQQFDGTSDVSEIEATLRLTGSLT